MNHIDFSKHQFIHVRYKNNEWPPDLFVIFLFKMKSVQNEVQKNISGHIWAHFVVVVVERYRLRFWPCV
jgi:hypothetical protein